MNKISKIFFLATLGLAFLECNNTGTDTTEITLNDYTVQRDEDDAKIITYLKTHAMTVSANNMDVSFTSLPNSLDPECIWVKNQLPNATYPLLKRICISQNISYTIYYIKLKQGGAATPNTKKPCNLDGVFAAYKGRLMDDYKVTDGVTTGGTSITDVGTVFDSNDNPTNYFNLDAVIRGWSEIFPLFNSGSYLPNPDGTITYSDFGAGVMFVPSGLAYYNNATGLIPSYSPLIFNFKLYEVKRNDHDLDGIEDFNENLNGEDFADPTKIGSNDAKGIYIYTSTANGAATINVDDNDQDNIPDAYDQDDDNDRYPTKNECKKPDIPVQYDSNGVKINNGYYDFASIPLCSSGKKVHLDPKCPQ